MGLRDNGLEDTIAFAFQLRPMIVVLSFLCAFETLLYCHCHAHKLSPNADIGDTVMLAHYSIDLTQIFISLKNTILLVKLIKLIKPLTFRYLPVT